MFENVWALVVEDDAHSLMAIGTLLRDLGIFYKRNTTGSHVAEKVMVMEPKPNFILLDLDLPQGNPYLIVRLLKASPDLADIPVIAIADNPDGHLVRRVQRAGFDGLVGKPLPRKQFGDVLQRVMEGEAVWQVLA